jgi:hypothetical protein
VRIKALTYAYAFICTSLCTHDRYDDDETFAIVKQRFSERRGIVDLQTATVGRLAGVAPKSTWGAVTPPQVQQVYELHKKVVKLVKDGEVGRGSNVSYDFNLRDLLKLLDVLDGNAANMREHCESEDTATATTRAATDGARRGQPDIRVLALNSFASLVYARSFQSQSDQAKVMALIDKELPVHSI